MSPSQRKQLGDRGETLVAMWLQQLGWEIVAQQWHCRWGEIDLVAQHPAMGIAFVEVKTRRPGSLDCGGRLAITVSKQQKLWRSAQQFLVEHPAWGEQPCRFDVALVVYGQVTGALMRQAGVGEPDIALVEYIENAFQLE